MYLYRKFGLSLSLSEITLFFDSASERAKSKVSHPLSLFVVNTASSFHDVTFGGQV